MNKDQKRYCFNCGQPIKKGDLFCRNCNAELTEEYYFNPEADQVNKKEMDLYSAVKGSAGLKSAVKMSKSVKMIIAVILSLTVVGVSGFAVMSTNHKKNETNEAVMGPETTIWHSEIYDDEGEEPEESDEMNQPSDTPESEEGSVKKTTAIKSNFGASDKTTVKTTANKTTNAVKKTDWQSAASDLIHNIPAYTKHDIGNPQVSIVMMDLNSDKIPEVLVYSVGGSAGQFFETFFCWNGSKYVEGRTEESPYVIRPYKNIKTGQTEFWDGILDETYVNDPGDFYGGYYEYHITCQWYLNNNTLKQKSVVNRSDLFDTAKFSSEGTEEHENAKNEIVEQTREFYSNHKFDSAFRQTECFFTPENYSNDDNRTVSSWNKDVSTSDAQKIVNAYINGVKDISI